MSKFRKKPVEIEAVKFTRNNWDEVKSFTGGALKHESFNPPLNLIKKRKYEHSR